MTYFFGDKIKAKAIMKNCTKNVNVMTRQTLLTNESKN